MWRGAAGGARGHRDRRRVALVSGSTQGITSDCTRCTADAPNLAGQLERAHRSWKAYLESLPRLCARPSRAGRYAKKHDPFASDDAIAHDPSRCRRRVPLSNQRRRANMATRQVSGGRLRLRAVGVQSTDRGIE